MCFSETVGKLSAGECGIKLLNVTRNETGQWTCHMSPYNINGMDTVKKLNVRITATPLAAEYIAITTFLGSKLNIKCTVTSKSKALEYCRFVLPDGRNGFSLDETITEKRLLLISIRSP